MSKTPLHSDKPDADDRPESLGSGGRFAGRWQIPLLLLAFGLLVTGIWRLRPVSKPPTFQELFKQGVALKQAGLYPEASQHAESLLQALERTPDEKRLLHRLMVEIIHEHESGNSVHGPKNSSAILEHSDSSLAQDELFDAMMHWRRAQAFEWLRRPIDAVAEYRQAVEKGIDHPWQIRKRMIELRRVIGDVTPEELHTAFDAFLAGTDVSDELRYWAAEKKIDLYASQEKFDQAEPFLASQLSKFQNTTHQKEYDYLRALAWFRVGRLDDAERLLRALRDQVVPGDPLYARAGWLLGRIEGAQQRPEYALAFFEDVITTTVPGPYRTAAIFGRAEALADVERYDESVQAYEETIRLTTQDPYGTQVDLRDVRESTTRQFVTLRPAGRLREAMAFLRIAARLAPPTDSRLQEMYTGQLADLAYQLGETTLRQADLAQEPDDSPARRQGQDDLIEAGQHYMQLAKLVTLDAARSAQASWRAFESFDFAGQRLRAVGVLGTFVREWPEHPRVPEALLRLGQIYEVLGDYEKAVARYQQNLTEYPSTFYAAECLVPLANCFATIGNLDKAKQTLLRIVDRRPGDRLSPIEPEAQVYKDALFRLGDLYVRGAEFESAIARFEEATQRYPHAPETDRTLFMLANAYRLSAARIREDVIDKQKIAYRDELLLTYQKRLERAHELFGEVIRRYLSRPASSLAELDKLYSKLSHFYRADAVYDLSFVGGGIDHEPFARALTMYDRAAWEYQRDPVAMSAYTQMINCHLRMGNAAKAKMALQRARWALRNISDEAFQNHAPDEGRQFWENYFSWLEQTPTFAGVEAAETG